MTSKTTTQTLSFWTEGESYTNLLRDFFRSGEFTKFEAMLGDGNLDHEQKVKAFKLQMSLTGDTRTDEGLICHFSENPPIDFPELLYYAIRTSFNHTLNDQFIELEFELKSGGKLTDNGNHTPNTNLETLVKYIPVEEIFKICRNFALREEHYLASEMPIETRGLNGVISSDGTFIECGFQDHINLYPVLCKLGIVNDSDWTDCTDAIHISSGLMNGTVAHTIEHPGSTIRDGSYTSEQINTLFRLRKYVDGMYGGFNRDSVAELVRNVTVHDEDNGGKWGNLAFLNKFYPHIKTPNISKERFGDSEKLFMRTSPKISLPGLLNSRMIGNNDHDVTKSRNFIQLEFEKYKNLTGTGWMENKIHWFFQELIDGSNGVCHIYDDVSKNLNNFEYQLSPNQGDIVNGVKSDAKLSDKALQKLREIAGELFNDIEKPLQLEFVVREEQIYIVQLRILKNNPSSSSCNVPDSAILIGKSFSKGSLENIKLSDILIVDEDAKSEQLIGKKGLIVKSDVAFSHILALSKALYIPSMYATGDFTITDETFNFTTLSQVGYLYV